MKPAALAVLLILQATPRIAIRVNPTVLLEGGAVRLTCRVARHPDNRWLALGLANYRESRLDLDGEAAPVTHVVLYEHVPCGTGEAYCAVGHVRGVPLVARHPLLVAGC